MEVITGHAVTMDTAVAMVGAAMDGADDIGGAIRDMAGVLDLGGRTGVGDGATRTATAMRRGITLPILTTIRTRAIVRRDTRARRTTIRRPPTRVQGIKPIRQGPRDPRRPHRTRTMRTKTTELPDRVLRSCPLTG